MTRASSARNAISIAPTLRQSFIPSLAPAAAASTPLTHGLSTWARTVPRVSGSPSSGNSSFEITSAPGAAITEAAMRCTAGTPNEMYTAEHAGGHVREAADHDRVQLRLRQGREVGPDHQRRLGLADEDVAASHSDSAPEVPIVFIISQAIPCTTRCSTP